MGDRGSDLLSGIKKIAQDKGIIPKDSLNIPLGTQLRIPSNPGQAINLLSQLNS